MRVRASDAYARLRSLHLPALETSDVAAALGISTGAASMLLARLASAGLATRLRPGLWILAGDGAPDRYALAEALTAPFPSYLSLQTALYLHGMIEQVPSVIYVVSLARTQRIKAALGVYSVHHILPELFDGFETRPEDTKLASPEKALFDMAYFSGGKSRLFARVPELELPRTFRPAKLRRWTARIRGSRRRSMVETRLEQILTAGSAVRARSRL